MGLDPTVRCPSKSSDDGLVKVGRGPCSLLIRAELHGGQFEQVLLEGYAELQKRYALQRIKSAATSRVFKFTIASGGTERAVYFKEYLDRSVWDAIKHLVRPGRAMRAFKASRMLLERGFRVPEILVLGERRMVYRAKRCFVVTAEVVKSKPLPVLLASDFSGVNVDVLLGRRELIRAFGHTVGQMHRRSIVHGDLRLGNVLARYENERWEFFFLDNERTRRWPWLPAWLRLKNLVQVNMIAQGVTTTDRFRFFRAYLSACPGLRPCYKWWARKIQARTLERRDKYRRRGHTVRV